MPSNERTLKEILSQFVKSRPIKSKYALVKIKDVWREQLGSSIQQYTTDIRFRNGILTVQLSSAPLRQELIYGKVKLIELLNEAMGEEIIKDVKIY